jgi:hypothetical protein
MGSSDHRLCELQCRRVAWLPIKVRFVDSPTYSCELSCISMVYFENMHSIRWRFRSYSLTYIHIIKFVCMQHILNQRREMRRTTITKRRAFGPLANY